MKIRMKPGYIILNWTLGYISDCATFVMFVLLKFQPSLGDSLVGTVYYKANTLTGIVQYGSTINGNPMYHTLHVICMAWRCAAWIMWPIHGIYTNAAKCFLVELSLSLHSFNLRFETVCR